MDDELKEIINKIDRMRQEHERDGYNTRGYILFALAWAMLGLYVVGLYLPGRWLFLILAIVFIAWGGVMRFRARKVKVE
jgi:uncharacterized membrane protein YfcA